MGCGAWKHAALDCMEVQDAAVVEAAGQLPFHCSACQPRHLHLAADY